MVANVSENGLSQSRTSEQWSCSQRNADANADADAGADAANADANADTNAIAKGLLL